MTSNRPPILSDESYFSMADRDERLAALARELPDQISRLREAAPHLSEAMVVVRLWRIGALIARHNVVVGTAPRPFPSRENNRTLVIPMLPDGCLNSFMSRDEREALFVAAFPEPVYRAPQKVPTSVWRINDNQAASCTGCGVTLLNSDTDLSDPQVHEEPNGALYCAPCGSNLRACNLCGVRSASVIGTHRVPTTIRPPYRVSQLVAGPFMCSSCVMSSGLVTFQGHMIHRSIHQHMVSATIQSYSFQPAYRINAHDNERLTPDTLCFGLELECGHRFGPAQQQQILDDIAEPDIYFKNDGSIVGFEMISHPFTWRYWNAVGRETWSERLRWLQQKGIRSYNAPNCGMHVHMSLAAFSVAQTTRVLDLVYGSPDLFQRISQRDIFDYCRFFNSDVATLALRRRRAVAAHSVTVNKYAPKSRAIRRLADTAASNGERRVAINFPNNKPTLEVRLFRGTLHAPSFAKNIEVCHALHAFTTLTQIDSLSAAREFVSFVYDNERDYPNLAAFLDRWHKNLRPQRKQAPQQYAVVRTSPSFEFDTLVANNS
jgi:hypothetical protein